MFLFVLPVSLVDPLASAAEKTLLRVGHVGHDHHLALFMACAQGEKLKARSGGVWLRALKPMDIYELLAGETVVAQVKLIKVKGGSGMPAALGRGDIEVGLGGLAPTVLHIDKGAPLKIVAPLNADGDMLLVKNDFAATSWDGVSTEFEGCRPGQRRAAGQRLLDPGGGA